MILRNEIISNKSVFYINNDIQYGSKYILKRILDIFSILIFSIILLPVGLITYLYILFISGSPAIIKQTRVGLHGNNFNMYKFRTMEINSHDDRKDLGDLNEHSGPLFKINDDPRIINGAKFLKKI